MTATVTTSSLEGYTNRLISVESDMSNSLPGTVIVGLGTKSIDEAKERIRSAIKNSQLSNPKKRITINLSPANVPKDGSHYDLAIALSILLLSEQIPSNCLNDTLVLGELGLDGSLKPVQGVIGHLLGAQSSKIKHAIIPAQNLEEARLIPGFQYTAAASLRELYEHLTDLKRISNSTPVVPKAYPKTANTPDLSDVAGNLAGKKALIIAAAGWHNLLFSGPPGGGKTMLAHCLPGILPALRKQELIETTLLHSIRGKNGIVRSPPIRSPHHSSSHISIVGGGTKPLPGEASLAHNGVLFLDELPEFSRQTLESLRQPLETDSIDLARAGASVVYPAKFLLVATRNPCPCGYYMSNTRDCNCVQSQIDKYQQKVSGPLLDRIDLQVNIQPVDHELIMSNKTDSLYTSTSVKERIITVRKIQHNRQNKLNSRLSKAELLNLANISPAAIKHLTKLTQALEISTRAYLKVLRTARTIADLEEDTTVETNHINEALTFRV